MFGENSPWGKPPIITTGFSCFASSFMIGFRFEGVPCSVKSIVSDGFKFLIRVSRVIFSRVRSGGPSGGTFPSS